MSLEVQLQLVFARLDVQPLQVAVEVVDDADEVPVDVDLGVTWRDLQAR